MIRPIFGTSPMPMPEAGPDLHVSASTAGLREASGALDAFSARAGLPATVAWRLHVALDEILSNIVRHGAASGIDIAFKIEGRAASIVVSDDGPPFDPLSRPAADVRQALESRSPGGLGVSLVRGLMDDVTYARTDRNILTLRTRIAPDRAPQRP